MIKHSKNLRNTIKDLFYFVSDLPTVFLVGSIALLIMGIVVVYLEARKYFPPGQSTDLVDRLVFTLIFFISGLIGIVGIVRKEFIHGFIVGKGKIAVISAWIFLIITWGLALYGMYLIINDLIS
jgi:hypothetical protein